MRPHNYKEHFIAAVVKRCGICRQTVEQVLPAVFDEIRYQLAEGSQCVPIESFGTFALIDIPERQYPYTYKGKNELRTLPPTQRLKFAPTRNMRREVIKEHRFDSTRKSFVHDPHDPPLRRRKELGYRPNKYGIFKGATKKTDTQSES